MRRGALVSGIALAAASSAIALSRPGMTLHMAAHMIAVAVAAPLLALGLAQSRLDLAARAPRLAAPIPAMLTELALVWGWHLPAARDFADATRVGAAVEQALFLAAGLALWSAVLGARVADRRAAGIAALLLTSMHMTLLGALIGLAPRPLYPMMAMHGGSFGLDPLSDQQLGGVVMLMIGGVSYMAGGLAMLAGLLRRDEVIA